MKNTIKKVVILASLSFSSLLLASGGGEHYPNESFSPDLGNKESLQKGARLYVDYCLSCHGLKYQRYNRVGKDAGMTDKKVKETLIFTGQKVGMQMKTAMPKDLSAGWFGITPPDLTLVSKYKGKDFVYNYLKAFYKDDDSRLTGVNNSLFPNMSMPHVLVGLEGVKEATYTTVGEGKEKKHHLTGFKTISKGSLSAEEYNEVVYDLSNFLYYVGDPSKIQADRVGWKILLFLLLMTGVFYALKKELWKDLH